MLVRLHCKRLLKYFTEYFLRKEKKTLCQLFSFQEYQSFKENMFITKSQEVHAKWFCKKFTFFRIYIYRQVGMFSFARLQEKLGKRTGYDDEKVWEESGRLS